MDILGMIMFGLGALGCLVFGVMVLISAFQKHILWGLAYLFLPFASMIYVVMNWDRAGKAFLLGLLSTVIALGGIFVSPTMQKVFKDSQMEESGESAPASTSTSAPAQ